MLYSFDGDLFESDCTVLIHQCNCQKNMGKGIAAIIASRYPEAVVKDNEFPYDEKTKGENRLGSYSIAYNPSEKRYIVNLYGQWFPGKAKSLEEQEARYKHFKNALSHLMEYLTALETKIKEKGIHFPIKIGIPCYIGSNLAGGSWGRVFTILEDVSNNYQRDFYIYKKDA